MTWGEIQIESLKKMFLNKTDLDVDELMLYKDDKKYKTYLFAMRQACNEALIQIYTVIEPSIKTYVLKNENKNVYDLSDLIQDYENLYDVEVPNGVTWTMKTKNILKLDNWGKGDILIYYEKKRFLINHDLEDTDKVELPEEYARIIPLYIAGELYKDDDLAISTMYLNEFSNLLSALGSKNNYISNNKISLKYRME